MTHDERDDSATLVEDALRAHSPSWLPGIAGPLAEVAWTGLWERTGIAPNAYGTARYLAGDAKAERDYVGRLAPPPTDGPAAPAILVETLREERSGRFTDIGLRLAAPALAGDPTVHARLAAAMGRLTMVPGMAGTLGPLLSVVHVLDTDGPDYDVSYSDPELPFSIFVGVHAEPGANDALRLAEGVLHECMHLQLTLIEGVLPMVSGIDRRLHSPWKGTMRPVQGVLHGAYVFGAIRDFMLAYLRLGPADAGEVAHARDRVRQVRDELGETLPALLADPGLTASGRLLTARLMQARLGPDAATP